jgi:predicted AlkP superfamily pyrophosphatase or phosphodiesterase
MSTKQIIVLFITAALFITAGCSRQQQEGTGAGEQPKVLLISIDGFIKEYAERNNTPNLDRIMNDGVVAEYMIPVFPTKTFPNHWTLVTGLYVENHGIITNNFYDYELEARFSYGPQGTPNDERWWGGEPIWNTAEKQGLTAATFFWPGSEATLNGVQPTKWMEYDGEVPYSTRIDSMMSWLDPAGDVRADFGTLYFSTVDSRGHAYGKNSEEVDEAVAEIDGLIGYLLEKVDDVGLGESLNIIILSDHGMSDLSEERVIFLEDLISLNDVEIMDWTPVAMIRPKEGRKEQVYQALKENEEHYSVYLREEMPERYHFKNHYRIPEIIMIADPGYSITNRSFFETRGLLAATHGFDNRSADMRTFFAAKGPAFKNGETVEPFESVHVYELMSHILKLDPAPNDGSLDSINHVLAETEDDR